jgi:hypothetical protein
MIDEDDFWSNWWNEDWQGKPKYSEKTCPSATLSTTKSHMTRAGLEPQTVVVGSQRLTAWAMARPILYIYIYRERGSVVISIQTGGVCFRSRSVEASGRRLTSAVGNLSMKRKPPESSKQDVRFHGLAPLLTVQSKSLSVPSAAGKKLQPLRTRWHTKHSFHCVLA